MTSPSLGELLTVTLGPTAQRPVRCNRTPTRDTSSETVHDAAEQLVERAVDEPVEPRSLREPRHAVSRRVRCEVGRQFAARIRPGAESRRPARGTTDRAATASPSCATRGLVRPRTRRARRGTRTARRRPGRSRPRSPAASVRTAPVAESATTTGADASRTSPPAVSTTAASIALPTSRFTRSRAAVSSAPECGTPSAAYPGRPRSWNDVEIPAAHHPHLVALRPTRGSGRRRSRESGTDDVQISQPTGTAPGCLA